MTRMKDRTSSASRSTFSQMTAKFRYRPSIGATASQSTPSVAQHPSRANTGQRAAHRRRNPPHRAGGHAVADRSWCQVRQPMGFRGRCRATTTPTAASETATAICALPVASGFCRAPSDSGISAAARSTVTPTSAHAVAGVAHPGRAPAGCASPTDATLRRHRSGNVTAEQASVRGLPGKAGLAVFLLAPGSRQVRHTFFNPTDMWRAFVGDPKAGYYSVGEALWLNIRMFVVAEILILIVAL